MHQHTPICTKHARESSNHGQDQTGADKSRANVNVITLCQPPQKVASNGAMPLCVSHSEKCCQCKLSATQTLSRQYIATFLAATSHRGTATNRRLSYPTFDSRCTCIPYIGAALCPKKPVVKPHLHKLVLTTSHILRPRQLGREQRKAPII